MQIDATLARRLIDEQFPQWAARPLTPVEIDGWDNRTFRLGTDMSVRLPSAEPYALQVDKEHRWLPALAPQLPLPVPVPIARGVPGCGYPYDWSVYRWLDGRVATIDRIDDLTEFATTLAEFLVALQRIDASNGPAPGLHNFFRGAPLDTYEDESRAAIATRSDRIDGTAATAALDAALATTWDAPPVWIHGDVAATNLLVDRGRLGAVLDFGCSGVGDPACDMVIAWTLLAGESRDAFRRTIAVDDATWIRGSGWALWKALITVARLTKTNADPSGAQRVIDEVLADHRRYAWSSSS